MGAAAEKAFWSDDNCEIRLFTDNGICFMIDGG
jgi:hypothetical protein